MKKFTFILIFAILFIINVEKVSVNADSTSDGMGFDVSETTYGYSKDHTVNAADIKVYKDGYPYIVGWSKFETAAYTRQDDADWALVIMKTHVQPKSVAMPWVFGLYHTYDGNVTQVNIHSDIDDAYYAPYPPYVVYRATDFILAEPDPMYEPDTDSYTIGIKYNGIYEVFAETEFYANELTLDYNHDGEDNIFDVDYNYKCKLFSCDYRETLSYQRGLFLVDMTNGYNGTTGDFINIAEASFSIYDASLYFQNYDVTKTIYNRLVY